MEEQITQQKVPFYKRKIYVIPLALFALISIVSAVVFIASIHVNVSVNEALSTTTTSLSISGFPGETIESIIDIHNEASVPLNIELSCTETSNVNGVTYTTDMPKILILAPGDNNVSVSHVIASNSSIGSFEGDISITRI